LPGQTTQQRYDLQPLLPSIESGFTLLTPNVRLARRIKSAWNARQAAQGTAVWEPLPVYPLELWLLDRWHDCVRRGLAPDRVVLQEQQALTLWQRAIDQEQAAGGRYHLLQGGAAASLAHQARERLLRWQVDCMSQPDRQVFELEADCASFLAWSARFQRFLDDAGMATPADCFVGLLQAAGELAKQPLLLVEFDDMPPLFRECINALGSPVEERTAATTGARCSGRRFPDRRAELSAAARWAHELSRREPGASIGIVLSDMASDRVAIEYLLRKAFDCLGEHYTSLPVNFSTGITLDRAPVVRDAMSVLRLGLPTTTGITPAALLRSRFLRLPDRSAATSLELLRRVSDCGKEALAVADLRFLSCTVRAGEREGTTLGQYLMSMSAMRELRGTRFPSRWLGPLNAVLDIWGWPGEGPLDSLEYQQVQVWYETLDQLAAFDDITDSLTLEGVLALLQRLLATRASQPQTADSLVQVLGPLEAAGLAFDYLWICGVQADRWPAVPRPSPLIPGGLQRRLQMPHATAEREWVIAEGLMRQYLGGTGELIASYAMQLDGIPELPSALLADWDIVGGPAADPVDPGWLALRQTRTVEALQDTLAPPPEPGELDGLRGGSALLEDQSQCPFRAFARRRLGAEALGDIVQGVSQADRGSLLHRALHLLFQSIPDSEVLAAITGEDEAALVKDVVSEALDERPRTGIDAPPGGWRELESDRLERLLRQWLAVERQRETFRVAATEEDLDLQLATLKLRLRVDRIDRMPDGSTLILDYKSGTCRLQDWLGDRPGKPQLLLYAVAGTQMPSALAFAQLRPDDCAFVGAGEREFAPGIRADIDALARGGWDISSWESLNNFWRERLQMLADEFLAGEAAVEPQPAACDWCGLAPLCRVDREGAA
jgi:probable DNA repair protein